jgi:hypothetical protein
VNGVALPVIYLTFILLAHKSFSFIQLKFFYATTQQWKVLNKSVVDETKETSTRPTT